MNLIEQLEQAIDIEYDAKNQEIDELLRIPVEDRIIKGETLINLKVHFEDSTGILKSLAPNNIIFTGAEVYCRENFSKFREGSPVILSRGDVQLSLDVVNDNGNVLLLEAGYYALSVSAALQDTDGWQLDPAKVDIRKVVKKSIDIMDQSPSKFEFISNIFYGRNLPEFSEDRRNRAKTIIQDSTLNDSQKEAFTNAYSTKNFYLIQGPPGSGKTWLLAHLAIEFAKEGKKVFITANTHTAINNALQKCSILSSFPHIVKVGKRYQKENLNHKGSKASNIEDLSRSDYANHKGGLIVGATCYAPYTRKMEQFNWDIVIIDEAGQLSVPLAIAAMVKGEKYIFIGDHKQLPPILSENHTDPIFQKSIFEHLFSFHPGKMLDLTYRMNKDINRFPSKQFYGGSLRPHPDNADWRLEIDNHFKKHQEILDIQKPEVLYCHFHTSAFSRSEFEAILTRELVSEYLEKGIQASDIAIITPFRQQVKQILNLLSQMPIYDDIKDDLFVDTIERIQGQERDIVIFSLATSDPVKAKERADFFFSPNRLNVALTRAKKKRIVIANKALFNLNSDDSRIRGLIKNFKDFYDDAIVIEEKPNGDLDFL